MTTDDFQKHQAGLDSPFEDGEEIVADTDFSKASRGIWVGGDGDVWAVTVAGTELPFRGAKAGTIIPGRFTKVLSAATGSPSETTSATGLVAVW